MAVSSGSGQAVETVFIPEADRGTLVYIVPSWLCAGLRFLRDRCAQGFNRNLTSAEIIGQVRHAIRELPRRDNGDVGDYQCCL